MSHIVICGLPRSTIFFHITSYKARNSKKKLPNTKCLWWFSLQFLSETFIILRRNERDTIKKVNRSSCHSTRCSRHILIKLEFPLQIFEKKNTKIWNFMKTYPVGAELLHAGKRTDRWRDRHDKVNGRLSKFCKRV